jgi:hypothetical protein
MGQGLLEIGELFPILCRYEYSYQLPPYLEVDTPLTPDTGPLVQSLEIWIQTPERKLVILMARRVIPREQRILSVTRQRLRMFEAGEHVPILGIRTKSKFSLRLLPLKSECHFIPQVIPYFPGDAPSHLQTILRNHERKPWFAHVPFR